MLEERFDGRCALYAFTDKGATRAWEIAAGLGLPFTMYCTRPTQTEGIVHVPGNEFKARFAADWGRFDAHIFIGAVGIAVRAIAPLLRDKIDDPAVLACPENGGCVISLTSGHLGGANRLARRVARITGGRAVISTATDVTGLPAFDEVVARERARILNAENIRAFNAALLAGESVAFCGPRGVFERHFAATEQVVFVRTPEDVAEKYAVLWDAVGRLPEGVQSLEVSGRAFVLGVGCRRGVDPQKMFLAVASFLSKAGLSKEQIASIASCDLKADEPAVLELGSAWQVPVTFYSVRELDAVPVPTPSEQVRAKIGTASVCEAACLLSAGRGDSARARLYASKTSFGDVTLALARLPHQRAAQGGRGEVVVVGLGSGAPGQLTPDVAEEIRLCDTLVGYSRYVDFIRDRLAGKNVIRTGMKGEVERCRAALEAASAGRSVCMVCSGDPGILAMAGLAYELRFCEPRFADVPIRVLPGITAATIAAASLGAPLQNGFSLVSLSDLLVPADEVRRNLLAVARSVLPVALYNPAGHKRRALLEAALEIFRQQRGAEVLCAFVKNAGRPEETKWTGKLCDLPLDEVDMSTLVFIGGPRTRLRSGVLYETRGYVEKYLK